MATAAPRAQRLACNVAGNLRARPYQQAASENISSGEIIEAALSAAAARQRRGINGGGIMTWLRRA